MKEVPTWMRPTRWLAFFLTLLGVCSFLAIIPVSQDAAELVEAGEFVAAEANWSFIDYLREGAREVQVNGHWTSLLPPLLAVMIAAFFRTMVGALVSAFVVGSFLSYGLNPLATAVLGVHDFLIRPALSQFSLMIIGFLVVLVGSVHVMSRSGGLDGMVGKMERFAKGRRSSKVAIGLSGLLIFFDDYSNTVVVGSSMQRLSDRWKISREKLAYLVDSTTAPVAGIALLSTWVAFEIYLLGDMAAQHDVGLSGYGMLIAILPLRFYCIGTLIFLFLSAASDRDYGPMLLAERRAYHEGKLIADGHKPLGLHPGSEREKAPPRWYNAGIPLLVIVLGIVVGILLLGAYRLGKVGTEMDWTSGDSLRAAFGAAVYDPSGDSDAGAMPVMLTAALVASLVAIALPIAQGVLKIGETLRCFGQAFSTMWMAVFILTMAWSMREICETLGTAQYLVAMLGESLPLWALPLLTFLVAAVMSFATGTSWGTMGILIPILMPLAAGMGALEEGHFIIYLLTAAAILDGSIFGDHCSPISDTTVLSSISTGCDHIAHVNTQLYYALTTVCFSGVLGYAAVAHGLPVWSFYLSYPLVVGGFLWLVARKATDARTIVDPVS